MPASLTTGDGLLTMKMTTTNGISQTMSGGLFQECRPLGGVFGALTCAHSDGTVSAVEPNATPNPTVLPVGMPRSPVAFASTRGVLAQAGNAVISRSNDGSLVASYAVPSMTADISAGVADGPLSRVAGPVPPTVSGYAQDRAGLSYALSFSGTAAQITRLSDGRTAPLTGFSALAEPVLARDGDIYVPAWQWAHSSADIQVLKVDPQTLTVLSAFDTGVAPGTTDEIQVLATPGHDLGVVITTGTSTLQQHVQVLDKGALRDLPVPSDTGLAAAVGSGDSLLLFGGSAQNVVSRLDLSTGILNRDLPAFRAPTGSYVMSVAEG